MLSRLAFDALSAVALALTALLGAYAPAYLARRDKLAGGSGRSLAYVLGNMLSAGGCFPVAALVAAASQMRAPGCWSMHLHVRRGRQASLPGIALLGSCRHGRCCRLEHGPVRECPQLQASWFQRAFVTCWERR